MQKRLSFKSFVPLFLVLIGISHPVTSPAQITPENANEHAQELIDYFAGSAQKLLMKAIAPPVNLSEFQGMRLQQVLDEMKTIRYQFQSIQLINMIGEQNDDPTNTRWGGHYRPHLVQFSYDALASLQHTDMLQVLALHECLGALGYSDRNYERSVGLYLIVRAKPEAREILLRNWGSNTSSSLLFRTSPLLLAKGGEGTSTHVGGGGDFMTLRLKYEIIQDYEKKLSHSIYGSHQREKKWADFAGKLQWLNLEPADGVGGDLKGEYRLFFEISGKPEDDSYKIAFNSHMMQEEETVFKGSQKLHRAIIRYWTNEIKKLPSPAVP